jgi:hypothetical protein
MTSEQTANRVAIAITVLYVVVILLYGLFVIQSLLLSVLIALPGVLIYFAWRYLL